MSESEISATIGDFNAETHQVPVTFTCGVIEHSRDVNACVDDAGAYDAEATAERVAEVARGVQAKIAAGIIRATEPGVDTAPAN